MTIFDNLYYVDGDNDVSGVTEAGRAEKVQAFPQGGVTAAKQSFVPYPGNADVQNKEN